MVFVAREKRPVHACLRRGLTLVGDELSAYSKRTQTDRRKSGGE